MLTVKQTILENTESINSTTVTEELNISNTTATVNFNYLSKEKTEDKPTKQPNNILFIPEKVAEKLQQTLSQNPPTFSVKNRTDYFIYIIHLLYDIPARNRNIDLTASNGFVPVYKQLLKKRVDEYPKYLNYLVDKNIIEKGKNHIAGVCSSELRISPALVSNLIPIEVTKQTLIKSMNKYQDVSNYYKNNSQADISVTKEIKRYSYLDIHFNDKLKIDVNGAYNYLKFFEKKEKEKICLYSSKKLRKKKEVALINKLNVFKYQINYLNIGNFYNKVDNNVGRYNSNLTNIKKELRNYITYDNNMLVSIDNVSSQPYFSITVLEDENFEKNKMGERIKQYWRYNNNNKDNKEEREEVNKHIFMIRNFIKSNQKNPDLLDYKNLILSGLFYEKFAIYISKEIPNKVFKDNDSRKYAKMALLKTIFADKNSEQYWDFIPVFKKYFPTVYTLFNLIKKDGKQHHLLACILQNLEAETILGKVCGVLCNDYPDIPPFTIHDSIITTQPYIEVVKDVMRSNLYEVVGEYPNFKVEYWQEKETNTENK
jgi:hypothetical protein